MNITDEEIRELEAENRRLRDELERLDAELDESARDRQKRRGGFLSALAGALLGWHVGGMDND